MFCPQHHLKIEKGLVMKQKKVRGYQRLTGYLFMAPAAIMIIVFMIVPLLWNVALSFCSWNGNSSAEFVGIANYLSVFSEATTLVTLKRSVILALTATAVSMLLGMLYAFLLYRLREREQQIFRFVFFSPAMLPMTVTGLLFVFVLSSNGLLNALLSVLGLESLQHAWLADPNIALWVLGIVQGWKGCGVTMMLCTTAILALPDSLYECARLEGANYWQQVRIIMLPLIKPTLKLLLSMTVMSSFKSYDIIYAMTKGGPGEFTYTTPMKIIQLGFTFNEYGTAAALGTVLVLLASFFVLVARFALRGETYEY